MFVYSTVGAKPFAKVLVKAFGATGDHSGANLAPLKPADLLAALAANRAGDFVLSFAGELEERLRQDGLLATVHRVGGLRLALVSRGPLELAELGTGTVRVGLGKPSGPLGAATLNALARRDLDVGSLHVAHRSERSDELVRMTRLGALDAAVVWHGTPVTDELRSVPLGRGDTDAAELVLIELACSRIPARRRTALVRDVSAAAARDLASLGVAGGEGTAP